MASAHVAIRKPLENATLTVEVKCTRELKVRLWLGTRLLFLAALLLGCRLELKD